MEGLPEDCLRILFEYFTYDEVSKLRPVCKRFNTLGGKVLNSGFKKVRSFHLRCIKEIKESLPRRESERRHHHLYPRHDILQAVETRLSLLSMTYSRPISDGQICFIPGKVLDEVLRILQIVNDPKTTITHSQNVPLLQEMRDISSMAMEHFDEHIQPMIDEKEKKAPTLYPRSGLKVFLSRSSSSLPKALSPALTHSSPPKFVPQSQHVRTVSKLRERISNQGKTIAQSRAKIRFLENLTTSLSLTVNEQKGHISEIVKQLSVVQGILGVQTPMASPLTISPGISGDINNNSTPALKLVGKRPSCSTDSASELVSKKSRR